MNCRPRTSLVRRTIASGCALVLAACTPSTPLLHPSPTAAPPPSPSATAHEGLPPLITPSPAVEPTPAIGPVIHEQPGPLYETILSIPVGNEGIRYRGVGVSEMEITGPNGVAVLPDGSFVLGDTYDNRLLRYDAQGNLRLAIDLFSLGIINVSDVVSTSTELYVLEISFSVAPVRYRVSRLSFDGRLIAQYDIPEGFHFEDGLMGLVSAGGRALLELRGPLVRFYLLPGPQSDDTGEIYGLPAYGRLYQTHYPGPCGGNPSITVGRLRLETGRTLDSALDMLAVNPDGSFYVVRGDLVDDAPVLVGDQTIHFISAAGEQLGAARYPLAEWYFHLMRYLTVGPDGNVYALITRPESVDVIRLSFYRHLEPLLGKAAEPVVSTGPLVFSPGPNCDCSRIRRLPPASAEAQRIVQEFIANFRQDRPTESMALEQVWALDRLGEYALLQGSVTQEESNLLMLQRSQRGYVLVAEYVVNVPDPRHSIIPEYFRAQVPDAPPELTYCLDLSRYTGEGA